MTRVLESFYVLLSHSFSLSLSPFLSFCRSNRYTCTNAASSLVHFFFHVTTAGKRAGRINISHRRFDLVLVAVAASSRTLRRSLSSSESKSGGAKRISESLINLPFYTSGSANVRAKRAYLSRARVRARASARTHVCTFNCNVFFNVCGTTLPSRVLSLRNLWRDTWY